MVTKDLIAEIYHRLKLIDPELYSNFKIAENKQDSMLPLNQTNRQTGRTTFLLARAISLALLGKNVVFISHQNTEQEKQRLSFLLESMLNKASIVNNIGVINKYNIGLGSIILGEIPKGMPRENIITISDPI